MARFGKIWQGKIRQDLARLGKIWQGKIKQDLARYDKVRFGKRGGGGAEKWLPSPSKYLLNFPWLLANRAVQPWWHQLRRLRIGSGDTVAEGSARWTQLYKERPAGQPGGRQLVAGIGRGPGARSVHTFKRVPQRRRSWLRWVTSLSVAQFLQRRSRVVMEESLKCFVQESSPTSRLTTFAL